MVVNSSKQNVSFGGKALFSFYSNFIFRATKVDDVLSPANPANIMNEDYKNPNFNVFAEGPAPVECNDNKRIVLKMVPDSLKPHAVESMMRKFGNILSVDIPMYQEKYKEYKEGFKFAFVEFSKFR